MWFLSKLLLKAAAWLLTLCTADVDTLHGNVETREHTSCFVVAKEFMSFLFVLQFFVPIPGPSILLEPVSCKTQILTLLNTPNAAQVVLHLRGSVCGSNISDLHRDVCTLYSFSFLLSALKRQKQWFGSSPSWRTLRLQRNAYFPLRIEI